MIKQNKAITLIVLIITIIVLLILAAVTINMVLGENGLFNKAKTSVAKYENAQGKENSALSEYEKAIDSIRDDSSEIALLKQEIENLKKQINGTNPPGTVISYIGSGLPDGYLACDGTKYNVSDYPILYAKLKDLDHTGWNEANWTTEFTVPDLRGEFLRGTGNNTHANNGNGSSVGTHQDTTYLAKLVVGSNDEFWVDANTSTSLTYNPDVTWNKGTATRNYYNRTGNTTAGTLNNMGIYFGFRPTNTSVLYCIKY